MIDHAALLGRVNQRFMEETRDSDGEVIDPTQALPTILGMPETEFGSFFQGNMEEFVTISQMMAAEALDFVARHLQGENISEEMALSVAGSVSTVWWIGFLKGFMFCQAKQEELRRTRA